MSEEKSHEILGQLMCALLELKKNKVAHRDVKLDNIILAKDGVRLVDFGFACSTNGQMPARLGTPMFMAPELFGM